MSHRSRSTTGSTGTDLREEGGSRIPLGSRLHTSQTWLVAGDVKFWYEPWEWNLLRVCFRIL